MRDYTSRHITPHFVHRASLEELVGTGGVSILGPSTEGVNNGAIAITTAFVMDVFPQINGLIASIYVYQRPSEKVLEC